MRITIQLLTYLIFSFFSTFLYGQYNYVLNSSFEKVHSELLSCDHYRDYETFNRAIDAWSSPSPSSPDIFHLSMDENCDMNPLSLNSIANILPRTGNSMVGLAAYLDDISFSYREYAQGKLRVPLVVGHTYHIQFYVILSEKSNYAINNLGIKFFQEPYFQEENTQIDGTPDYYSEYVISEKKTWTLIEFDFTPQTPDLNYFIIGHFFDYDHTTIEKLPPVKHKEQIAYYLLDDVSITSTVPTFDALGPFCKDASFSLPEVSVEGYKGTWSPEVNNQETTTYTFTPEKGQRAKETTLTIEIQKPTQPQFTLPSYLCAGTAFSFLPVSDNGIRGNWSPAFDNMRTTNYTFQPEANEYCTAPYTVTLQIKHPKPNTLFYYCFKNQLFVEVFSPSKESLSVVEWKINDQVIDESSLALNLSHYTQFIYASNNYIEVTTSNAEGCLQTDYIELNDIQQLCLIPRGISPNGDGLNDFFELSGFGGVTLEIINRYGTKVYENPHYTNQWQGQSNAGNSLPSGTYFYQFVSQKGERITGWIELTR